MEPAAGTSCEIDFGGARLTLLGARAVWWAEERVLLVADVHLGKPASFRERGAPVPEKVTAGDLSRLDALIARWRPERVVVLGDLAHDKCAWQDVTLDAFSVWRARHAATGFVLVRGNHDRWAADPPASLGIEVVEPGWRLGGLAMHHEPPEEPGEGQAEGQAEGRGPHALCGHLHPGVRLGHTLPAKRRRAGMRGGCFWFRGTLGVLPAFGRFTGCHMIRPARTDRVFVLGDDRVMEVRAAGGFLDSPSDDDQPMHAAE